MKSIGIRVMADEMRRLVVERDDTGFLVDWQGGMDAFVQFTTLAELRDTLRNIETMADEAEGLFQRMWGDLVETAPYAGAGAAPSQVELDKGPHDDQPCGAESAAPAEPAVAAAVAPAATPEPAAETKRGHNVTTTAARNRAKIVELHATGASAREIAEVLTLGQSTVYGHLKAAGLLPDRQPEATAAAARPFRAASRDDADRVQPGDNGRNGHAG